MSYLVRVLGPVAFVVLAPLSFAFWIGGRGAGEVPIERILPQLEKRAAGNASDAHAQYLLGRVHGAAFARGLASVRMHGDADLKGERTLEGCGAVASNRLQGSWAGRDSERVALDAEQTLAHLTQSLRYLSHAIELSPGDPLYHLGFACSLDAGAHLAAHVDSTVIADSLFGRFLDGEKPLLERAIRKLGETDPERPKCEQQLAAWGAPALPALSRYRADHDALRQSAVARLLTIGWREMAIVHYERAFVLSLDCDRERKGVLDVTRSDLASYEAAKSYIRLVEARGVRGEVESKRVEEMRAGLVALKAIAETTPVSPILVPDAGDATLGALFDGASATFDLSGVGLQQTWPWPTSAASFLVWDPECTGAITSGRQLFGSATWWMFFEDGYRALEALDEDGDGWLVGRELEGLALWRDVDRDGVSDAGEVASLAARGLVALNVRSDGADGLSPTCSRGALFADGSARPTFDWVASPLPPQP